MLGDLYSNGYGVAKDEKKALAWFSLAADRGDKQAIFALAMARFAGRGGTQDMAEAAALLEKAAKLGHVAAAYNLALLYLEGQQVRQDVARAAELLRGAADAGSPEAQYALATLYKEGNGVPKDPAAAAKLLAAAARTGNVAAEVEYAIALFNGTGTGRTRAAPPRCSARPRRRAMRSRRTASRASWRPGAGCRPMPAAAAKWHTIAKAGGVVGHVARRLDAEDQGHRARIRRERRAAVARARPAGELTCPRGGTVIAVDRSDRGSARGSRSPSARAATPVRLGHAFEIGRTSAGAPRAGKVRVKARPNQAELKPCRRSLAYHHFRIET